MDRYNMEEWMREWFMYGHMNGKYYLLIKSFLNILMYCVTMQDTGNTTMKIIKIDENLYCYRAYGIIAKGDW